MKKIYLFAFVLFLSINVIAADVDLIVQKVDNHGMVEGNTYRLYAHLPNPNQSLHIVWGDTEHPLSIESSAPFFQNTFGTYSSMGQTEMAIEMDPTLAYDSYITLGFENSQSNDLWDLGMDFSAFDGGGEILANNGAWFLIPTNEKCSPNGDGLVLLAQFTTTGVVTGQLNLQGWSAPQVTWQALGLKFSTSKSNTFGCTDPQANNFDPQADFATKTCTYPELVSLTGEATSIAEEPAAVSLSDDWQVFPNPMRDDLLHIQFRTSMSFANEKAVIEIYDAKGSKVMAMPIPADSVLPGNRLTINQHLAPGSYKVVLKQGAYIDSKTVIVER